MIAEVILDNDDIRYVRNVKSISYQADMIYIYCLNGFLMELKKKLVKEIKLGRKGDFACRF